MLHQCGYVHNDLKLENILIGNHDPETIYLIDFGLSKSYIDKKGNHKEKKFTSKFSGNFMFASLNSCRGNNKSRRDDIQSLMYIMVYLLKDKLPWSKFNTKYEGQPFETLLKKKQKLKHSQSLIKMAPAFIRREIRYALSMKFDDEPRYEELIKLLKEQIEKSESMKIKIISEEH